VHADAARWVAAGRCRTVEERRAGVVDIEQATRRIVVEIK
jgi:hypothetical protein